MINSVPKPKRWLGKHARWDTISAVFGRLRSGVIACIQFISAWKPPSRAFDAPRIWMYLRMPTRSTGVSETMYSDVTNLHITKACGQSNMHISCHGFRGFLWHLQRSFSGNVAHGP